MSLVGVIRGFAEASLAVLAFAMAILLIGIPVALIVRGLHEGLSRLVRPGGEMSTLVDALVSLTSVAGGLVIALAVATLLVRVLHGRSTFRARAISGRTPHTEAGDHEIGRAA